MKRFLFSISKSQQMIDSMYIYFFLPVKHLYLKLQNQSFDIILILLLFVFLCCYFIVNERFHTLKSLIFTKRQMSIYLYLLFIELRDKREIQMIRMIKIGGEKEELNISQISKHENHLVATTPTCNHRGYIAFLHINLAYHSPLSK